MKTMPSVAVMQRAFASKDVAFDGTFIVAVKTTGIFCRPTCRAKAPRPENVEFFPTAAQALRYGYRPCKRCHPMAGGAVPPTAVVELMRRVETGGGERITGQQLRAAGIDPSTARRQFQAWCGMTFAAYQRARLLGAAMGANGRSRIRAPLRIDAQLRAGYRSASGFRAALKRTARAAPPSAATAAPLLTWKWISTPLGRMLAVTGEQGIVLLEFDGIDMDAAIVELSRQYKSDASPAICAPGEHPHLKQVESELEEYFAGRRRTFSVPLDPRGTPFEMRTWGFLKSIPYGQTRSYSQQALAIGQPAAVRAVGQANGRNKIAIIIPCHRVIGASGTLTGYAGGMAKKRWLLDYEQRAGQLF